MDIVKILLSTFANEFSFVGLCVELTHGLAYLVFKYQPLFKATPGFPQAKLPIIQKQNRLSSLMSKGRSKSETANFNALRQICILYARLIIVKQNTQLIIKIPDFFAK